MRILYVIDGLGAGGKERQLVEIIKYLSLTDVSAGVVTFKKDQPYTEIIKEKSSLFAEINKKPSRLKPIQELSKIIESFKPDIIQSWDSMSSFYSYRSSRKYQVKFIDGSIRDAGVEKGWQYTFKRFFLKRADMVIANSLAGLKYYKINGEVMYNAIDRERFFKNKNISDFNIIMSANFTDYKDHITFIKAGVELLKNKIVDNIYMPGTGKNLNKIKEMVPEDLKERINFPGRISDVEKYISDCKVGILTSTSLHGEGVSNSVLEYMAGGLVPVVTDVGGSSEIIETGINGFLVPEKGVNEIINAVKYLKTNEDVREKMKFSALKTVAEKFDMKTNINKLLSFYSHLISSSYPQTIN
ncbi:hypothetical protein BH10BAC5_BH10BAC5_11510 [soil metagenome]